MKKIAIFASGRGSNAMALIAACRNREIEGTPVWVFSDRPGAPVLKAAQAAGIPTAARSPREFADKHAYECWLVEALKQYEPDLICLAGYMRLVGAPLLAAYPLRIMNIHPALLPSFPGLHAQAQAIAYGVKVSGCTVHFVDAGMDSGPIIYQTAVPVLAGDDEESLAARILLKEHETYIRAVAAWCRGDLIMDDRRVEERKGKS